MEPFSTPRKSMSAPHLRDFRTEKADRVRERPTELKAAGGDLHTLRWVSNQAKKDSLCAQCRSGSKNMPGGSVAESVKRIHSLARVGTGLDHRGEPGHVMRIEEGEEDSPPAPRARLEGLLQELVKTSPGTNQVKDGSGSNSTLWDPCEMTLGYMAEITTTVEPSETLSPLPKKKQRMQENHYVHRIMGTVVKLYDRSVDLSKFNETTPLYPVCREWMLNNALENRLKQVESVEPNMKVAEPKVLLKEEGKSVAADTETDALSKQSDSCLAVSQLPAPLPLEPGQKPRIPPRDPQPKVEDIPIGAGEDAPAPTLLLTEHLKRWQKVRRDWIDTAARNEARYTGSQKVLKEMFRR
ncbi:unnamed protein product [Darwinula stevensoni]|uniref:Uncharacterized protein n=1 Tax=Darwinula stevensoni TaxID=69355 RepID=A0A7R9A9J9_9CRUS|nr:unnamed protein product [Darwinula stevensoni]CAG0897443.1 unnamed protein product [Darwinula stevensoni]